MVEVLDPIAHLMCTSIKKTRILIQAEDEDKWRPGVQVEDTKVLLRLEDGSMAEYPRDPMQPQIIPLFGSTGLQTIVIPPSGGVNDIGERVHTGAAQVFPPTAMIEPCSLWVNDTNIIHRLPDNTLIKYPRDPSQKEIIPALNAFAGPVTIEIPPSKPVGSRGKPQHADTKRKGKAKRVPYGLKQKAISRSAKKYPKDDVSKSEPSSPEESDSSTRSVVTSGSPVGRGPQVKNGRINK